MKNYDIVIAGAGAAGVFLSYELTKIENNAKIIMIDKGRALEQRQCPIKLGKTERCIRCTPCHIMNGYGGAGTLSDGKYNITTKFGGDLHAYVGVEKAMELMEYVDSVLCSMGGAEAKLYSTGNSQLKTKALQNNLNLLDAKVRHLGTDRNVQILQKMYEYSKDRVDMAFGETITDVEKLEDGGFLVHTSKDEYKCRDLVLATGRSGSKWIASVCDKLGIGQKSNR